MQPIKNLLPLLASFTLLLGITACDTEDELLEERQKNNPVIKGDGGSADFSNYIAIGNSISAGMMDAALYTNGQQSAFPVILAEQFQTFANGGAFNLPDINSGNGFNVSVEQDPSNIVGRLVLDVARRTPVPLPGEPIESFDGDKSTLNSFSVPGMTITQLDNAGLALNPFYARFATAPGSSTLLNDAIATKPTFFTFWLGGNDVLQYASSGGADESLLTDPSTFKAVYDAAIDRLMSETDAKGIVLNVPPVSLLPFFQAVPRTVTVPEALRDTLEAGLDNVNRAIAGWNMEIDSRGDLSESEKAALKRPSLSKDFDAYPVLIADESLSDAAVPDGSGGTFVIPKVRNIDTSPSELVPTGELILLSAGSVLSAGEQGFSPLAPLTNENVLNKEELTSINTSVALFNGIIEDAVATNSDRLALTDVTPTFLDLFGADGSLGLEVEGQILSPDFAPTGFFSTDGVHPNPRAHAITANSVLSTIESKFGAVLPKVQVLGFRGPVLKLP